MNRRTKAAWAISATVLVAGIAFIFATPMCACTPALIPASPTSSLSRALDTLAVHQERYYVTHGRYADTLSALGVDSLFAAWDVRIPIANDRGFDFQVSLTVDSLDCTYTVRRVTNDTSVARRTRCHRFPT